MKTAEPAIRELVQGEALKWLGTPYLHQASLKGCGCDCLGLVRGIWREVYQCEPEQTPAYSASWAEAGRKEVLLDAAARHMKKLACDAYQPGDLLVFRWRGHLPAKHLGIAMPGGTMVHAQEGAAVCRVSINGWWFRHLAAAFKFPDHRS